MNGIRHDEVVFDEAVPQVELKEAYPSDGTRLLWHGYEVVDPYDLWVRPGEGFFSKPTLSEKKKAWKQIAKQL